MLRLSRWLRHLVAATARPSNSRSHAKNLAIGLRIPTQFECLEARTLLSTLNIDAARALTYTATLTLPNNLTISLVGGVYTFNEGGESIIVIGAGAAGCTGTGTAVVVCPDESIDSINVDVGDMNDRVTVQSLDDPATVIGGLGDDTLDANSADVALSLDGGIGGDSLIGGTAGDSLTGGTGDDNLSGGSGNDTISGGPGNDILAGGGGIDRVIETGDTDFGLTDSSLSGLGNDNLSGFEQASLTGGAGNNTLDASAYTGTATLEGLGGDDSLAGGQGADSLLGGAGHDTIAGELGNDTLAGGSGKNRLLGGGGTDMADYSASTVGVKGNLKVGTGKGDGKDRLEAIEGIVGSDLADSLMGNDLANLLIGHGGNDKINGLGGDDTISGGAGNDNLLAGFGNDLLLGGASNDILIGHAGRDLLIGGVGDDDLVGTGEEDILVPGSTDHDATNEALVAIMAEWTSGRDYATRVGNIQDGSGSVDLVNEMFFLNTNTVHDDNDPDRLTGSTEDDWFFAFLTGPKKDQLTDRAKNETLDTPSELNPI